MFTKYARSVIPTSIRSSFRSLSQEASHDISAKFKSSLHRLKNSDKDPPSDVKLKMYALFKQSTEGPCNTSDPSFYDLIGQTKHQAWKALGNKDKQISMEEYCSLVEGLFIGEASGPVGSEEKPAKPLIPIKEASVYSVERIAFPRRQKEIVELKLDTIHIEESTPGAYVMKLNRPSRGNAFNIQMWQEIQEAFDIVEGDNKVKAVILTGNSTSFSTGMDLSVFSEMQSIAKNEACDGRKREALNNFIQFLQDAVNAPEKSSVPVIAAISGQCIGGAVDLVCACDLRYCTDDAQFCIKETDLAMVADIGTLQRLPGIIGDQATRELAYTGRTINGKEAERLGLVLKSFSTEEMMREHVNITAAAIAEKSPITIRGIKKTLLFARDHTVTDSLAQIKLYNTAYLFNDDLQLAMRSMMMKEKPTYKGE